MSQLVKTSGHAGLDLARARKELDRARADCDFRKLKDIRDLAKLVAHRERGHDRALDACELVAWGDRYLGEILSEVPKASPAKNAVKNKVRLADSVSKRAVLEELKATKQRASEWERIAAIPEGQWKRFLAACRKKRELATTKRLLALARVKAERRERVLERVEAGDVDGAASAVFSSESAEWYTPARYVEIARSVMGGIDLDPASSVKANETVRAQRFYTRSDDGLSQPWEGRVWLNPPYEGNMSDWIDKAIVEYRHGAASEVVLLVNATPDRKWFTPLFDFTICFTDHRIAFELPEGDAASPVSGNALVYLGSKITDFARACDPIGSTVQRVRW